MDAQGHAETPFSDPLPGLCGLSGYWLHWGVKQPIHISLLFVLWLIDPMLDVFVFQV